MIRACSAFYGAKLTVYFGDSADDAAPRLARSIEDTVIALGLPRRIGDFGLAPNSIAEIAALLKSAYPTEVADLGIDADHKLDRLLESIW